MSKKRIRIDFETAKEIAKMRAYFRSRHWDDDIERVAIRTAEASIYAAHARKAKVRKHDEARTLLQEGSKP